MKRIVLPFLLVIATELALASGEHRQLLPQPQRITYGAGRLPIKGLKIGLASNAGTEDRFAAAALAEVMAAVSGVPAPGAGRDSYRARNRAEEDRNGCRSTREE